MSLLFGMGQLTISGVNVARLMNINMNISYDTAPLRGGNLIFPTYMAMYNGNIEGTFEVGDINLTAMASMLGAGVSFAAGSGTLTLTATQVLATGADIVVSCVTNGVTGTLTIRNCRFSTIGLTIDRENFTIPSTNFIACGDSNGQVFTFQT